MSQSTTCSVEGCAKPRYQQRLLCSTHAMRKHRYGDVHADRTRKPAPYVIHSGGYRKVIRRDHPLADGDGYVYEHRLVLFEAIGGGEHSCRWCGRGVTWRVDLEVDHIDHDRLNNALSNLAPSCHGCNTRRALGRRWADSDSAYITSPS